MQMGSHTQKRVPSFFISGVFNYLFFHDVLCHLFLLNVFLFYLQHNKELEKERDNLRLEMFRLK